jgi:hypothetical protein
LTTSRASSHKETLGAHSTAIASGELSTAPFPTSHHYFISQPFISSGDLVLLIQESPNLYHSKEVMSESALDKHIVVKIPDHFLPDAFIGESVGKGKEDGATVDNMDPSRPFLVIKKSDLDKADEVW